MTDRPILFSAAMVRALLDGRKTQTRRLLKPKKHACLISEGWTDDYVLDPGNREWLGSYYRWRVGDRLWVRESFSKHVRLSDPYHLPPDYPDAAMGAHYWADGNPEYGDWQRPQPSIHMPRWASRLTLTVTDVRVERLQAISEADVIAEGIQKWPLGYRIALTGAPKHECLTFDVAADAYRWLWNSINGAGGWEANPWIVAVSFRAAQHNIDQLSRLTVSCTDAGSMRA